MPRRGSVALSRSIELFTIITAAYLGYITLRFGSFGHDSFLGWLGAFMLLLSAFASVLFLSLLVKPD